MSEQTEQKIKQVVPAPDVKVLACTDGGDFFQVPVVGWALYEDDSTAIAMELLVHSEGFGGVETLSELVRGNSNVYARMFHANEEVSGIAKDTMVEQAKAKVKTQGRAA
jgi:hypothetical protein